jgi:hypothetical protein
MVHTDFTSSKRGVWSKVEWTVLWVAAISAALLSVFADDYGYGGVSIFVRIIAAIPVMAVAMLAIASFLRARAARTRRS